MTVAAILLIAALFLVILGFAVWPLVPCIGAALVLCIIAALLGRDRTL